MLTISLIYVIGIHFSILSRLQTVEMYDLYVFLFWKGSRLTRGTG